MNDFGKCKQCGGSGRLGCKCCSCDSCYGSGKDPAASDTWHSCLFTARASHQTFPAAPYTIPDHDTRLLRARLILEEAVETIKGLGFAVWAVHDSIGQEYGVKDEECYEPDLEQIIDGVCDLNYVAAGTLVACGVPDLCHQEEVIARNNAKFPGGVGVPHPEIKGKFGKPDGWFPPNHKQFFPQNNISERESR